jgi:hypothetical protein
LGPWCRPVSDKERGELNAERWYAKTWRDPQLLDLIQLSLLAPRPSGCQTENYLVDKSVRWRCVGHLPANSLLPVVDHPAGPLWENGESTGGGLNDRVSAFIAARQKHSLILVQPDTMKVVVGTEGADTGNTRRRIRGHFSLAGYDYVLAITDPVVEKSTLPHPDGYSVELQRPILCISLSEKFASQNACYKLIAGVMQTS